MQPPFNWKQRVNDDGFENPQFGLNETKEQLYIIIDQADEQQAIETVLGYPRINPTNNNILRVLPQSHPRYPWLYATKQGLKRRRFVEKRDNGFGNFAEYQKVELMVEFQSLPFDVKGDTVIYEWERFVNRTAVTSVENIKIPRGAFVFTEGPLTGDPFQQERVIRIAKTDVVWTWHQVPKKGLVDDMGVLNTNIRNGLGKVNSATFPAPTNSTPTIQGFPAGTLLFLNAVPTAWVAPVNPTNLGLALDEPPRIYNVEFRFLYLDPPPFATTRGHNIFPQQKVNPNGTVSVYQNWAAATSAADGSTLYPTYDFNLLFKLVP